MPGVAEGLIYAPVIHKVLPPSETQPIQEHRAGLDWGTSTGAGGSATALVIGTIGQGFNTLNIKKEYFHSNAKQSYKDDMTLVAEIIDTLIKYIKDNKVSINNTGGYLTLFYDYAAHALGGLLEAELRTRKEKLLTQKIIIKPCYKFNVPVRIDIVKALISQGRYKASRELTPNHFEELEGSM